MENESYQQCFIFEPPGGVKNQKKAKNESYQQCFIFEPPDGVKVKRKLISAMFYI